MDKKQEKIINDALKDVGKSIKMKHTLVQNLESEYQNMCKRTENNLKELEELTASIYNVEGYLNASECRLANYRKKEVEWVNENISLKDHVEGMKKSLNDIKNLACKDDSSFDLNIMKLVESIHNNRSYFDSNTTKESLHTLKSMDRALVQEILDIENMWLEERKKFSFMDSEEVTLILKDTNIINALSQEINYLLYRKNNSLKRVDYITNEILLLEEKINRLKKSI